MSITATERTQIVELTTLMFNAAPGATYLSQIVALYEANGHNLSVLADQLASTSIYQSMNPSFQTAAEFATKFLTPLGLQGDAFANSWITSQLNAGVSKQQVAYAAMQALMNLDPNASAQYQAAKAVLVNKTTVAEYYSATLLGAATDLATLQTVIGSVTADPASVTSSEAVLNNQIITGITQSLTTGVDSFNGTSGNDTFNSQIGAGANSTLTALDSINGGTGTDTLNINDIAGSTAMPGGVTIQNVEIINLASAGAATFDVSGVTGLTNFNVTQSTGADVITAGAGQAVNVTDTAGAVTVTGGSAQTVATSAGAITLSGSTGPIAVTDTKIAANTVNITDGSNVSVTATGDANAAAGAAQFTIGSATNAPSGTVTVSSTGAATTAATNNFLGNISVTGGTSVAVTEVATSDASSVAKDATGTTVQLGDVSVAGNGTVTSVSVTQTPEATQTAYTKLTAGAIETDTISLAHNATVAAGSVFTLNGLTFTTAKVLTDAQVLSAFANLANGVTQGSAPASYGIYSGTFNTVGGSTGAVTTTATGSSVTFTAAASGAVAPGVAGLAIANVITGTADAGADQAGVLGVTDGVVAITDGGSKTIASVTLDGYGAGSSITSDALTTLNLAHSINSVTVTNAAAASLSLGLNAVGDATLGAATVNLGATYKTLNIVDTTANSVANVNATGVTALTISGDHAVDLSGATFGALKTVAVSGGAGVTIDVSGQAALTDFNASGTSGNNTVTINASAATYEGGSGKDSVTLSSTTVSKAVSLGAGDDTLALAAGTTTLGAVVSGGDGTDTLKMAAADAITASATTAFQSNFTGFEKLSLGANAAAGTVDLANMNGISYVVSAGGSAALTLKHMANAGTLELTAANTGGTVVTMTDATGTTDSLNVVTKVKTADINFGNVTAAGVESINFTATDLDTSTTTGGGVNKATVNLIDAAVKTIVITGSSNFALTLDPTDLALTSIDGSAMTGKLTAGTSVTGGATIMGGSGADTLTANGNGDTLLGNAGNDTLVVNGNLDTLTGGAGKDTFNVAAATTNVNSYATITDFSSGDKIQFAASATSFAAAKITLGSTAVFQDYANAAIAGTAAGNVSWFQYGGDTYVIDNVSGGTSFANHTDIIVKLAGAVDLSTDSFSSTAHTLLAV
jgi:S-layer protein